ncbi:hypothetical protein DSLASN_16150 [Desulfoluna limicola]|uniref:Uncharacterized protein n=1 Tax=Desulfoluna limicola TaxID=2810562 RepID=A0ABM7PEM0_9BACT|nr:hypothetical protein DSLASN_16150 [Desulfoluna limicola]
MTVTARNEGILRTQNARHGFLLDFLTLRAAECPHLLRYQSIEANHDICSSDALNMEALNW